MQRFLRLSNPEASGDTVYYTFPAQYNKIHVYLEHVAENKATFILGNNFEGCDPKHEGKQFDRST